MHVIKVFGVAVVCLTALVVSGLSSAPLHAVSGSAAFGPQQKMPAGVQARKLDNGTAILADAKGMSLYTFAKDAPGKSACSGGCAKNWPPLAAAADAKPMGDWTVITRDDGSKQWAYKGQPLYIIEVMKMFNKIYAPFSGTIDKILIEGGDGTIVSKGQPLFKITPDEKFVEVDPKAIEKEKRNRTADYLKAVL